MRLNKGVCTLQRGQAKPSNSKDGPLDYGVCTLRLERPKSAWEAL